MPSPTIAGLDLDALSRAIEGRDAAAQTAFYADDAVLTTIDSQHGPSDPAVLRGRDEIGAGLAEVCARDMTHTVVFALGDGERAAVAVDCRYPDGVARPLPRDARAPRRAHRRAGRPCRPGTAEPQRDRQRFERFRRSAASGAA